jgi:hypothetical protein
MRNASFVGYTCPRIMGDRGEIVIGNKGSDYVSIRVIGPAPGGLWTKTEIQVRCDGWSGTANWSFYKGELRTFAEAIRRLYRDLTGAAELQPLEPNLTLTLTGDGKGHISAEGVAMNNLPSSTALTFSFSVDQTYLMEIADRLNDADPRLPPD